MEISVIENMFGTNVSSRPLSEAESHALVTGLLARFIQRIPSAAWHQASATDWHVSATSTLEADGGTF